MDWRVPPSCAAVLPNVVPFKGMHILLSEGADLKTIFSDAFSIGIPPNITIWLFNVAMENHNF